MHEDDLVARILATIGDHGETARLVAQLDAARQRRQRRRRAVPTLIRLVAYAVVAAGGIGLGIVIARQIGL